MHLGNLNASCYSRTKDQGIFLLFRVKNDAPVQWDSMGLSVTKGQPAPPVPPGQPLWFLLGWKGADRDLGAACGEAVEVEAELQLPLTKMRADVSNKTFDSLDVGAWLITNNTSGLCAIRRVMKAGVDSLMSNKHLTSVGL